MWCKKERMLRSEKKIRTYCGKFDIQTRSGKAQSILNVLYVPDLKTNLLSIGQLQEKKRAMKL